MKLSIVALGVKSGDLSFNGYQRLLGSKNILLRTENTLSCQIVKDLKLNYKSFDYLYDKSKNFDTLNKNIYKEILNELKSNDVTYAIDGGVCEDKVANMLIKKVKNIEVFDSITKSNNALSKLGIISDGFTSISAYAINDFDRFTLPLIIYDLDSIILASEWKIKLSKMIGEELTVYLCTNEGYKKLPLYTLDNKDVFDYSTVLVIPQVELVKKERYTFDDLMAILKILRAPNGCPWDRVQTHESIRKNLIEECYELIDAIDKKCDENICEEIGDILLQVGLHTLFLSERGEYDQTDILTNLCDKLIFRHTHIFGKDKVNNQEEALKLWDKNKQVEKGYTSGGDYLSQVAITLPSLTRGGKVIKRALNYNYQLATKDESISKIKSILSEDLTENSLKDLLLHISNIVKLCGYDGEELLRDRINVFIQDFTLLENKLKEKNIDLKSLSVEQVKELINDKNP